METYSEFLDRINSFEKKEICYGQEYFKGNKSIAFKVSNDNAFKPFYGDTIVFNLDDTVKDKLSQYLEKLYENAPECFCEKLIASTFHMTLHDLSNSPVLPEVAVLLFENELKVVELSKSVKKQKIKMRCKYIFNMVNTSLVLGLYPVDEIEYEKLMELYYLFDEVRELSYPLTPHITLAYYNIDGFSTESARKLEAVVSDLNNESMEIELDTENLYYQKFISMNDYINIINLGK